MNLAELRRCDDCEVGGPEKLCWMCGEPTKMGAAYMRVTVADSAAVEAQAWRDRHGRQTA